MKVIKILTLLFLVVIAVSGYFIYQKASNFTNPEFLRLENVRFKNVTLPPDLKITFVSDAIIHNPNSHGITISKVDFDVIVDGKETTHFQQDLEVEMPANSEFSLPLSFEVPIAKKEFFQNFKDVLSGAWKKQSIQIRTVGTITIRAARIQLDLPFDDENEYRLEDYLQ